MKLTRYRCLFPSPFVTCCLWWMVARTCVISCILPQSNSVLVCLSPFVCYILFFSCSFSPSVDSFVVCFFPPFPSLSAPSVVLRATQYHGWVFPLLPDLWQKLSCCVVHDVQKRNEKKVESENNYYQSKIYVNGDWVRMFLLQMQCNSRVIFLVDHGIWCKIWWGLFFWTW